MGKYWVQDWLNRGRFNLIEILADEAKKIQFLKELFHYQIRIE